MPPSLMKSQTASLSRCTSSRRPLILLRHFHCVRVEFSHSEKPFVCIHGFLWQANLRDFQNVRNTHQYHGFPWLAEQNNFQNLYSFRRGSTLESISYSPGFQGYSKNVVPWIRCAARRDNTLLLSPLENLVKSFPEIFSTSQIAFRRKEKDGCWKECCGKMWCCSSC